MSSDVQPPIEILPDEIFSTIFDYCVPLRRAAASMDTRNTPWSLSQVYSRWRRIALDTPSLWNNVHLRFRSLNEIAYGMKTTKDDPMVTSRFNLGVAMCMDLLRLQLHRSKDFPLKIRLHTLDDLEYARNRVAVIEELAGIVSSQSHRIQCLKISDAVLPRAMENLGYASCNLPALRHLKAVIEDSAGGLQCSFFRSIPDLSSANFTNGIPPPSQFNQWSHLTDLWLANCYISTIPSILPFLPCLQNLKISFAMADEEFPSPDEVKPVVLPSLTQAYFHPNTLLHLITAPKLQRLYAVLWEPEASILDVVAFIDRSQCSLDALFIDFLNGNPSTIDTVRAFNAIPDLRVLQWSYGILSDALAIHDQHEWLIPHLQELTANLYSDQPAAIDLLDVIERRWDAGQSDDHNQDSRCALRKIKLFWSPGLEVDEDIAFRVRCLKGKGLDVVAKPCIRGSSSILTEFLGLGTERARFADAW